MRANFFIPSTPSPIQPTPTRKNLTHENPPFERAPRRAKIEPEKQRNKTNPCNNLRRERKNPLTTFRYPCLQPNWQETRYEKLQDKNNNQTFLPNHNLSRRMQRNINPNTNSEMEIPI